MKKDEIKIGMKVFILNHYDIIETYVIRIYEDKYSDDEDFICTWVQTKDGNDHLEDVHSTEREAKYAIERKKIEYDNYVTGF